MKTADGVTYTYTCSISISKSLVMHARLRTSYSHAVPAALCLAALATAE